jgi:hypothetical protein
LALGLCLALSLTACGTKTQVETAAEPQEERFGTTATSTVSEEPSEAVNVTLEPQASVESVETDQPEGVTAETLDLTQQVVTGAVLAVYLDGVPYGDDPVYFWRALAYLVTQVGAESSLLTQTEEGVVLDSQDLAPFVEALFAENMEPYPAVTEENPFVTAELGATSDRLTLRATVPEGVQVTVAPVEALGQVEAQVLEQGEVQETYLVTLVDSVYTGENGISPYSIAGVEAQ